MKKIVIGIAVFVLVIGFCYVFITRDSGSRQDPNTIQPAVSPASTGSETGAATPKADQPVIPIEDQLVRELKKYYGKTISQKSTQASIYDIRNSIIGSRPDGRIFFNNVLKRAFPELADEIIRTLEKLDRYNRWLAENEPRLSQMSREERRAALWEKRRALFGDDAEDIWSEDMLATETRKEKVQETLAFLNESRDTTIEEKLGVYQDVLKETYAGSPEEYLLSQQPILAKVFFSIDSVQEELKQMSPDQRQMAINKIRREMGFTEPQIEQMEMRDAERNQRWDVGLKYMEERKAVVEQFSGPEQEEKLTALREAYFQDEAKTIELEEKGDFFRFERPRFFGRN